jgi:hypothetical protein
VSLRLAALVAAALLSACQTGTSAPPPTGETEPAFDAATFDAFIATKPTPDQFRATYPGILLVMPDDIATMEFRTDHSRYFAELDAQGRIVGGGFR